MTASPAQRSTPERDAARSRKAKDAAAMRKASQIKPAAPRIDPRLTHRIVTDGGQWAKGVDEAAARAEFKRLHSGRNITKAQVWAVTANTRISEMGSFAMPRDEYCEPRRLK